MKTVWLWVVGLMVGAAFFIWREWPDTKLRVIACDVGQGDALLITVGFNQVLIDTGPPDGGVMACLGHQLPFWDRNLEMVVVSHQDADHIGGLAEVLKLYRVDLVLLAPGGKVSRELEIFDGLIKKTGARQVHSKPNMQLDLAGESWRVLWPQDNTLGTDANLRSLVLEMRYGTFSALFTGDAPVEVERILLEHNELQPVTLLKVGHHGSRTSSSETFLQFLQPKIALIGVSVKNRYGHPHPEILKRVESLSALLLLTSSDGEVVIASDGTNWWREKK